MVLTKEDTILIKGLAIAFMLWHHSFLNTMEYGQFANGIAVFCKVCVSLFLFASGYGLTKQYSKCNKFSVRPTISFMLTRYAKFFLSYWFCMVLVMAVGHLCGFTIYDAYPVGRNKIKCFLLDMFGMMGYDSYIKTWWFNKLIIQLYLIFPILYHLLRNKYVAIVALVAFVAIEQTSCINVFCVIEGGIAAFFIGMLAAKWNFSISNRWVGFALNLLLLVTLTFIRFKVPVVRFTIVDGFLSVVIVNLMIAFKRLYSFPVLSLFGQYATIIYLTHTLLKHLAGQWFYWSKCAVLVYVVFMTASLLVAMSVSSLKKLCKYDKLQNWTIGLISKIIEK